MYWIDCSGQTIVLCLWNIIWLFEKKNCFKFVCQLSILFWKYCFKCLSWLFCLNNNCFVEPKMRTLFIAFCWITWKKGLFYYLFYSWKRLFDHLKEGIILLFAFQLKETVYHYCMHTYWREEKRERSWYPKLMKPRLTAEAVTVWKRTMT